MTGEDRSRHLLIRAEAEGIVCSGIDKGRKSTYALLEERVPPSPELLRDEALARLAGNYFRSHSPAGKNDFIWWSGLSVTEAREAIAPRLINEKIGSREIFIHESCRLVDKKTKSFHLLPAFDEYLIGYRERGDVLAPEYSPAAFNRWGTFYPVVFHNGKIVGSWKREPGKNADLQISFFNPDNKIDSELIEKARKKYLDFMTR